MLSMGIDEHNGNITYATGYDLKVRVSFTENVKSMYEIIEKYDGEIVSLIEGIHVATVNIEAGKIKKLIEEDTVDYVKGYE